WGKMAIEEAQAIFRDQAQALLDGGVDAFILETFSDLNEVYAAICGVRDISKLPLIVQMTIVEDGNSPEGTPPEVFTRKLEEWGADVIGLNCSVGPQTMLDAVERIAEVTGKKLSVQPNAGKPQNIEGRNIYLCSPEYMASYAKKFVQYGVRIVGGCCGTTPQHIKVIRAAVKSLHSVVLAPSPNLLPVGEGLRAEGAPREGSIALTSKSRLGHKLAAGEF